MSLPTAASARLSSPEPDPHLPEPPTDAEKYWYFGRQHRWLLYAQALSFSLIAYSVLRFSIADPRLLLFLVPMSLYAVALVVSLLSSSRRRRLDLVDHEHRVATWAPARHPSVDVFLPCAGEDLALLENTYRHVWALEWPAELNVYVLDDSARPEVEQAAADWGFHYLSRPDRGRLKKAGNLRYGYQHSAGELILILDADFVPRPDFLHETVPYFDDADTGIVQTPQFFDTSRSMNWLQRSAGATQELFYRWVQPGRDAAKAAICVGTCALYRRAALERSGGFAQIGHSEDVHTGVNLMKVGFFVRYVPILVSKGICPDSLAAFLNQQYRWCTGSMSLLVDQRFHNAGHISARQRLCFWAGFLYYIGTGLNAFLAPVPALVMLYGFPEWIFIKNSVWLLGAVTLWFVVLPLTFRGTWRVQVLRVQQMYSFAHAVAIVHLVTGRTRDWIATGAAGAAQKSRTTPLATTISRTMKTYIALSMTLIWVGLVRGTLEFGIIHFWAMIALACVASYVQLPILLAANTAGRKVRSRVRAGAAAAPAAPALALNAPEAVPAQRAEALPLAVVPDTGRGGARQAPKPAAIGPRSFRTDIQGLRAVAVLLVVLYHASVPWINGGYVGVDVFFVISGFLITGQLMREADRDGRISFLGFYAGRARRLLPPAAVVVVATLVAVRLFDSIFNVRSVTVDAIYSAFYALNYRLAAKGVDYQHADDAVSPLQHLWSLAVEEQFYLAWPLVLMACVLLGRRRRWHVLAWTTAVLAAASLALSVTLTVSNPPLAYFGMQTRAWQLMAGALLALGAGHLARLRALPGTVLSWTGLAMVVAAALLYDDSTPFPGYAALLPVLGAMAVIAGGFAPGRGASALLDRKAMQGLGKVSYAWYLWHWPMVILIPVMAGYSFGWQYKLSVMGLALWLAVLTLYLVENPSMRSRLRKAIWLPVGLGFSGVAALAAVAVAATIPGLVGTGAPVAPIALSKADTDAVQSALLSGVSVREAPTNLTPTVVDAQSDQPVSSRDGCHADFLVIEQPDCLYGDPAGANTMVLFGDSHAQQWLPALDAEAKALGWRLVAWTKAACPVADLGGIYNTSINRSYTECPTWREATRKKIEALNPDVVIVSQSDTVPSDKYANTLWSERTALALQEFGAKAIPVAYLLDTPFPRASVPECVATHIENVGACSFSTERAYLFTGRREALGAALEAAKVPVVDPQDWFCTSTTCPAIVGNLLVYRDGSHASATYSRWLAPVTRPLFVAKGTS